jgi:hypothetical protein
MKRANVRIRENYLIAISAADGYWEMIDHNALGDATLRIEDFDVT